jgi:hypothetical protein
MDREGPAVTAVLTVGLPLWRSRDCAWIALEGLCSQVDAPAWELLVVEEDADDALGEDGLAAYGPRLAAAGCVRVERLGLREHTWLGIKWGVIAGAASSSWMLLQGGDDLSHPTRLAETWDAVRSAPDAGWLHYRRGLFCDLPTGDCAEFDRALYDEDRTGVSMAVRVDLVRAFPAQAYAPPRQHGVDGWLRSWASIVSGGEIGCIELDTNAHREGAVYCDGARAAHMSAHRPTLYGAAPFRRREISRAAFDLRRAWMGRE